MSLLRYAASGVLRNRRRTLSSILGVLLAITFIAGTFIAIDSSTRATLDAGLNQLAGDFSYSAYVPTNAPPASAAGNGTALRTALAAVDGVEDVSLYRQVFFGGSIEVANPVDPTNRSAPVYQAMGVDPYHLPYMVRAATVSGSTLLPNGTLVLDSQTASSIQVKLGDTVVLVYHDWNGTGLQNYSTTFTLGGILTLASSPYGPYPVYSPGPFYGNLVAFNLRDTDWILSRLNLSLQGSVQVQGEIWIDRNRFVNPYDLASTSFQLTRLDRSLSNAVLAAGYSGSVNDNLSPALQDFSTKILIQRIEFLLLSFPVILLGLYLAAVGVDLGHAERRRELGVLKTRGASRRQVAMLLVFESLLGGFAATVLGLLFGLALSRFLISVVTPFGASAGYTTISLTPDTIIVVTILSAFLMGIASLRSARRTASLPVIEALRFYAPGETRIHYNPLWDLILIGYAVTVYVFYVLMASSSYNVFLFLIGFIFLASLPVAPVLIIIGSVRLLTRWSGKVYEAMARVLRPFARNLEHVISRNLSRNPRRSSNIAIIIALGLAFGVFVTSSLASQQAIQAESVRASVGADLSAQTPFMQSFVQEQGFFQNVSTVAGVRAVSPILNVNAQAPSTGSYGYASIVALDPSTYFSVSDSAPFYYEDPASAAGAQAVLATPGQVLITRNYATSAALQVGDLIPLSTTTFFNGTSQFVSVTVTVGGIVRFLPGTQGGSFYGPIPAPSMIYGSVATFQPLIDANSGFFYSGSDHILVALEPGADSAAVKTAIVGLGATYVLVASDVRAQASAEPLFSSFLGFIEMEIAFIVVILTAGLGLIVYAASIERTVEFAGITARGSSGWQTAGLLVGEAFVIMLLGVLIGFGVGLLTGYLSTSVTANGGGMEYVVPNLFVFPLDGILLVVLAPVAMLGTTVLVSWRIAKMNVARVLKMRGG